MRMIFTSHRFCLLLCLLWSLARPVTAQTVYCARAVGHTPNYERIFFGKGELLRSPTLPGLDDLGPLAQYAETNRIDRIIAEAGKERTNGIFASCLGEVPLSAKALHCPGDLLSVDEVRAVLQDTVAVPKSSWTNHLNHAGGGRYVFTVVDAKAGDIVIDLRPGGCAAVFFPDGTYRCVMSTGYSCLKR